MSSPASEAPPRGVWRRFFSRGKTGRHSALLTCVLALVVLLVRKPHAFFSPQFFVEDGTVFFLDDHEKGGAALFEPYEGYLHLIPRLIAAVAGAVRLEFRPAVYSYGSLLVLISIIFYVQRSRIPVVHKNLLALAIVCVPVGAFIFMHLTNLHSFTAVLLLVILLQERPASRRGALLDTALVLLAGLSGPFCIMFLPLLPLRWRMHGRSRYEVALACLFIATAAVQCALLLRTGNAIQASPFANFSFAALHGFVGKMLLGNRLAEALSPAALAVIFYVLLVVGIAGLISCDRKLRTPALLVALAGVICTAAGLYRADLVLDQADPFKSHIRYFYLPYLMAAWFFLFVSSGRQPVGRIACGVLGLMLFAALSKFSQSTPRDYHWADYADRIRSGAPVVVPINWKGWEIVVN